jgi:hypothetical protein
MPSLNPLALLAAAAASVLVAPAWSEDAASILRANRLASGGSPTARPGTLEFDLAYSGQGLTGAIVTVVDRRTGAFTDASTIGPLSQADAFNGARFWLKDPSGAVTPTAGGDIIELQTNQAYRYANRWWRPDADGASVVFNGRKQDGDRSFYVLTVTPKGGEPFEAWFDSTSHLLARTVEPQGFQTIVTSFSDYRPEAGVMTAHKIIIDNGDGPDQLQTETLTRETLTPPRPMTAFGAPNAAPRDWSIADGARQATVPFRLLNNHIYADVRVSGEGPFLFVFDTGGQFILSPPTAKTLAATIRGKTAAHGAGEGVVEAGFTQVSSIEIGDLRLGGQTVGVLPFQSAKTEGFEAGGMIGFEVFRRLVTRIDYGAHTLTFIDPASFDPKDAGIPVPFVFYQTIPQVQGAFDGLPGKFDIDTGSRVEVTLTSPFVKAKHLIAKFPKGTMAVDGWGVGGHSRAYITRGASLTLGPVKVADVIAGFSSQKSGAFADPTYQGNVGAGILKRFVVTFDYGRQIMYLKPLPTPVADTGVFDRSGMWINLADDGFEVVDVSAGGAAAAAGLAVGDKIVAVDSKPAGTLSLSELRMTLRDRPAGTVVSLEVKRGDKTWTVPVTLKDQV